MTIEAIQVTEFSTLLREFRGRARLTQNELAGLSAVSARTIRNLETGRAMSPRPETVRLLADGLRLSTESQARLSLAAGQSPLGATLHAAQGRLPSWDAALDRQPYGREHDLRLVLSYVHAGTSCLVSVSGFGGVGKSQLAAALVREAQHTLRSTQWLWLSEPAGPAESVAGTAFRQWYQELADGRPDAVEELVRVVGEQAYLVVVDGVDRDDDRFEQTLRELIHRCPRLTVIETTRRPVPQEGRHVVPLKPLSLPNADAGLTGAALAGHPALTLLLPLVRATQPDFQESEENLRHLLDVCRSLDGVPRAIEAAAAWFPFYPPAEVAQVAREEPGTVAASGSDGAMSNWLPDATGDALDALTDEQRCLASELAARTEPWTVDDLVGRTRRSTAGILESLRWLLTVGVIRPADDGSDPKTRSYTVLNLMRRALA